jgi:hypothetical protein
VIVIGGDVTAGGDAVALRSHLSERGEKDGRKVQLSGCTSTRSSRSGNRYAPLYDISELHYSHMYLRTPIILLG